MSSFGVVPTGFKLKTIDDILASLRERAQAKYGATINTQADSVLGMLLGIVGDEIAQLWQVSQALYRAPYPDSATADALDNVAALCPGILRLAAAPSTVTLKVLVDPGTVLPAGRIVAIGTGGTRWKTIEDVENSTSVKTIIEIRAESVDDGAVLGAARTIDTIITPVSGWPARPGVFASGLADETDTYPLADGKTLILSLDGGAPQTITFHTGDFVDITAATQAEVAAAINAVADGFDAVAITTGDIILRSTTNGPGSSIRITGGTAVAALGLSANLYQGFNYDEVATVTNNSDEPFVLVNEQQLEVVVDGVTRTVEFETEDFSAIGAAKAIEVAASINAQIGSYCRAMVYSGTKVRIESLTLGVNGSILVNAGAAATALDFPLDEFLGSDGDAVLGRVLETDAELRIRRLEELARAGSATVNAIRAGLRTVANVTQAYVYENDTDAADGEGRPAHSIEAIVAGGTDAAVAAMLLGKKTAGIQTFGKTPNDVTVAVVDSQDVSHDIVFTRPTLIDEYVIVSVTTNALIFGGGDAAAGATQVKDAIVAYGADLTIGDDLIMNRIKAIVMEVAGVVDVTLLKVENANPPTNTANITIALRSQARFASGRITVNVS